MTLIKEKKSLIKVRTVKQVIFVNKVLKTFYRKIEVIILVHSSKLYDVTLINVKKINLQTESCFIYHKSDYFFKECFNQTSRINALKDDEFD